MCIINSYRMSGVNNSDVDCDDDGRSHDDDDDEVNARNGTTLEESKKKGPRFARKPVRTTQKDQSNDRQHQNQCCFNIQFSFLLIYFFIFLGGGHYSFKNLNSFNIFVMSINLRVIKINCEPNH